MSLKLAGTAISRASDRRSTNQRAVRPSPFGSRANCQSPLRFLRSRVLVSWGRSMATSCCLHGGLGAIQSRLRQKHQMSRMIARQKHQVPLEVGYREDGPMSSAPVTDPDSTTDRVSRSLPGAPAAAPVRIVHLGLGNFHRAHQAWYTAHAPDADQWGIAGFTGRRRDTADALAPQDGLYTLITREAEGDTFELIGALSAVHAAADHDAYLGYLSASRTALVTITVTEAAYLRNADGRLDTDQEVIVADLHALGGGPRSPVSSLPARLVAGLLARREAGVGAITILSCDNLPENGVVTWTVVNELGALVDESLPEWIYDNVDFATSMVDRITPVTTDEDRRLVREHNGYVDASPVPTEPFSEWVVSGRFPAGRPRWEDSGVQLVDDVTPFEQRKLWLLNASHSLLAYAGSVRGHETIDQAIADPACREWVNLAWDEA